jgi:hypothetical protein
MRRLTLGILAHVDAGKTTLSEALLVASGALRAPGRVDYGSAFLDTDPAEKRRGVTIFSKQAYFEYGDLAVTLLDTPGHVDFSPEAERVLQVLDLAILVISAAEGVQGHSLTLWQLLRRYRIPCLVFFNKTDRQVGTREALLSSLRTRLNGEFIDFSRKVDTPDFAEELSLLDETLLNRYLEHGTPPSEAEIAALFKARRFSPCFFGSALRAEGITELLDGISRLFVPPVYPEAFSARVFKIGTDEKGARLSFLKITGGSLSAKMPLPPLDEKVEQLRLYSGRSYSLLKEAPAGSVVAVTGLTESRAGMGLGAESGEHMLPILTPVLRYRLILPESASLTELLPRLRSLEEEEPSLRFSLDAGGKTLLVSLMGEMQLEILTELLERRFSLAVSFEPAGVSYRETVTKSAEGAGHFEPLRHYAEVHLFLEPLEPGSGVQVESALGTELLANQYQQQVLRTLEEEEIPGILSGAPLTDLKITLIAGRAHEKHTESGDFRQAAIRALRAGLFSAAPCLLEPYYAFSLRLPASSLGRALNDLDRMGATFTLGTAESEAEAEIHGQAAVLAMQNYAAELRRFTKGEGSLSLSFAGFFPCRDAESVIAARGYDPAADLAFPADSVFCRHGSGETVSYAEAPRYMHLPYRRDMSAAEEALPEDALTRTKKESTPLSLEEIDAILDRTFYQNRQRDKKRPERQRREASEAAKERAYRALKTAAPRKHFLLVDGYNIIFAFPELRALAEENIDSARLALLDLLSDYQGFTGTTLIVVFDAYRRKDHKEERYPWHNLFVVYTKTAQTADSYIESFSGRHAASDIVTVATSDGVEQIIVRSQGALLLSASELREEMLRAHSEGLSTPAMTEAAPKNRPFADKLKRPESSEEAP